MQPIQSDSTNSISFPPQHVSFSISAFSGQALMHLPHLSQYSVIQACSLSALIGRFSMLVNMAEIFCLGPDAGVIRSPLCPIHPIPAFCALGTDQVRSSTLSHKGRSNFAKVL